MAFFPGSFNRWYFALFLTAVLWGSLHPAVKVLTRDFDSLFLVFLRFSLASFFTLPVLVARRGKLAGYGRSLWAMVFYGFCLALMVFVFFTGVSLSSATHGAILVNTAPVFVACFAFFLLREKLSSRKLSGIVLGFAGMCLVLLSDASNGFSSQYLVGDLLLIAAAVLVGFNTILIKTQLEGHDPLLVESVAFFSGAVFLFFATFFSTGFAFSKIGAEQLALLLYVVLFPTLAAFWLWFEGLKHLDVVDASVVYFLTPVFGVLLSNVWLGEFPSALTLLGLALVLSALNRI